MANPTGLFGLKPIRKKDGSPYNGAAEKCAVLAADAVAIGIGDPVKSTGTATADGIPVVAQAATTERIRGVVVGVDFNPDDLNTSYSKASTAGTVFVCPAEDMVFIAREDSDTDTMVATDVMGFVDLVAGVPNSSTGISSFGIDSSSAVSGTESDGATFQVLRLHQATDNVIGDNAVWEIQSVLYEAGNAVANVEL